MSTHTRVPVGAREDPFFGLHGAVSTSKVIWIRYKLRKALEPHPGTNANDVSASLFVFSVSGGVRILGESLLSEATTENNHNDSGVA